MIVVHPELDPQAIGVLVLEGKDLRIQAQDKPQDIIELGDFIQPFQKLINQATMVVYLSRVGYTRILKNKYGHTT